MADPLELAFAAFDQRNFDQAHEYCRRVLEADPRNARALLLSGLVAKKRSKFEEAAVLLEKSIAQSPVPVALGALAECLWRLGRLEEAWGCIKQVIVAHPGNPEAYLLEATILYGLRRFDLALERTLLAQTYLPESYLVEARLGCLMMQLERYQAAEIHFWNAAHFMPSFAHCRLINIRQDLWQSVDAGSCLPDREIKSLFEARGAQPCTTVVAVSCDVRYFYKHGAKFVNSFAQNAAAGKLLHLHILDPDEAFSSYIDSVISRVKLPNLAVTTEQTEFAASSNHNSRRTFYSCARFLRIGWLLERYKLTVACFDVDLVFDEAIDAMLGEVAGRDVGLVQREPPDSPWLDIYAGFVVANNTERALRYFNAVANFIRHYAGRDELYWHLDQIALYCVLKMMTRFAEPPRIGWISSAALAAVWHIGKPNDYLLKEERVTRYEIEGLAIPTKTR